MLRAVQYYRAPFPHERFWADDLARIRDAGLQAVQLWCLWGWIEPEPGVMRYDDYDRLIDLAAGAGLQVLLSTSAEIQPFWIHRVVPGSELVDGQGRAVASCTRNECNVGLTPGGCCDHPEVAARMGAFLTDIATRYAGLGHLYGWDCWNETRWNVHAPDLTCFCDHTLAAFRAWLEERYGDLAGLNAAWQRRYCDWADVRPRRMTKGPGCDQVDFARFQNDRVTAHARWRYQAIRAGDPQHVITAHGPMPTVVCPPVAAETPLCRCNDWELADVLDGVGSSHFPTGERMAPALIGARLNQVRSSAGAKPAWVSELQGASGIVNHDLAATWGGPQRQGRWLLEAAARGYQALVFWCWRDEVFGGESGNHGLSGNDGLAEPRLAALRQAAGFCEAQAEMLARSVSAPVRIGVLFDPESFYRTWARQGHIDDARHAITGYAMALENLGLPYRWVEARHRTAWEGLRVLLVPWAQALDDDLRAALQDFISAGGQVLCEAELDAYDDQAFFRYPAERPLARWLGLTEQGRRPLPDPACLQLSLDGRSVALPVHQFITPMQAPAEAQVLAHHDDGALALRVGRGQGAAWVLGAFSGRLYREAPNPGLEALVAHVCAQAGVTVRFQLDCGPLGQSAVSWLQTVNAKDGTNQLWLFNHDDDQSRQVALRDAEHAWDGCATVRDMMAERDLPVVDAGIHCDLPAGGAAVVQWPRGCQVAE